KKGRPIEVPLLGVTEKPLPLFDEFVLPERYEHVLTTTDPDPRLGFLFTGPLPKDFPADVDDLDPKLRKRLKGLLEAGGAGYPPGEELDRQDRPVWYLKARGKSHEYPVQTEWTQLLERVVELLAEFGYPADRAFVTEQDARGQVEKPGPPPTTYDRA